MRSIENELKRLARNQCATFDTATRDECLLQTDDDGSCVCHYFRGLPCTYFETHVLPAYPDLIAEYTRRFLDGATD